MRPQFADGPTRGAPPSGHVLIQRSQRFFQTDFLVYFLVCLLADFLAAFWQLGHLECTTDLTGPMPAWHAMSVPRVLLFSAYPASIRWDVNHVVVRPNAVAQTETSGEPDMAKFTTRQYETNTHFILIHGSWHGGWCWQDVAREIVASGARYTAIDLPGHGNQALIPKSYGTAPQISGDFGTESSPLADIHAAAYANSVISAAHAARGAGAGRVVGVGHSMGGVPLTFAVATEPDLFDGVIYVAALAPAIDTPAGTFLALPEQRQKSRLTEILHGDPEAIGALRINPASSDTTYLETAHAALAADVSPAVFAKTFARLTPDAPYGIYGEVPAFTIGNSGSFGVIPRRFIRCLNDQTLVPSSANAIIKTLNEHWPKRQTEVLDLASAHEPMLSCPQRLAQVIMAPPV